MNNFVQWSDASAARSTGDPAFDALEGRIRAAKETNKAYVAELNSIGSNFSGQAVRNSKTEVTASYSEDQENSFLNRTRQSEKGDKDYDKFIAEFRILTRDMTDFLEKNKLSTVQHATGDPLSLTLEAKRKEENIRRKEIKDKINSLLQQYDKSNDRIPLWRHRMRGNFMPRPEQVLKGKALFRGLALAVWVFYAKPKVQVLNKKRKKRNTEEENFSKTLLLFRDACNSWMAKLNRLPIQSVQQDNSLDFNPYQSDKAEHFRKRMIQLKVRVKAVVQNIVSAGVPPPHVTKFLGVLIEDGHYFKKDFFFDSEREKLDFNSLGATRAMLQPIADGSGAAPEHVMSIKGKLYNIERPKILIRNFLLVKILIGQQLLSPWSVGICSKPRHNRKKILANFRVLATLIYEIVSSLDSNLPVINPNQYAHGTSMRRMSSMVGGEPEAQSWASSVMSWLMRSGADDIDAGLEQALLTDHPIFESLPEMHRFLYVKGLFAGVQSSFDPWMKPLAVNLGEWVDKVVRHVLESKYENPDVKLSPRVSARKDKFETQDGDDITGPEAV